MIKNYLIRPIYNTLSDTHICVGYGVTTLPHLRNLAIVGPHEVTGVSDNPARRRVFSCRPMNSLSAWPAVARAVVNTAVCWPGNAGALDAAG